MWLLLINIILLLLCGSNYNNQIKCDQKSIISKGSIYIQITDNQGVRDGYRETIIEIINKMNKSEFVGNDELLYAIPRSEEEYLTFYSLTYPDMEKPIRDGFYELNNAFKEKANARISDFFIAYLQLSQFVDGEYADGYFEDVEFVIKNNIDYFCEIYPSLPVNKVKRLQSSYTKHCCN